MYKNFEIILTHYIKDLLDKAVQEGKLDKNSFGIKSRTKAVENSVNKSENLKRERKFGA